MLSAMPPGIVLFHTKRCPRSQQSGQGIFRSTYSLIQHLLCLQSPGAASRADRADGSSQPRTSGLSGYDRRPYRRNVPRLETQLITVTYPVLMPENVLHFEG